MTKRDDRPIPSWVLRNESWFNPDDPSGNYDWVPVRETDLRYGDVFIRYALEGMERFRDRADGEMRSTQEPLQDAGPLPSHLLFRRKPKSKVARQLP